MIKILSKNYIKNRYNKKCLIVALIDTATYKVKIFGFTGKSIKIFLNAKKLPQYWKLEKNQLS